MTATLISSILLLPALIFFLIRTPLFSSKNLKTVLNFFQAGLIFGVIGATLSIVHLFRYGSAEVDIFSMDQLGFSVRIDQLSILMFLMISIIGFVVVRFSKNYLDGDEGQKKFLTKLAFTIAFVQLLVLSGNIATILLAWIGTSIGLHQLLLFYPDRKKARLAARKKFVIARLGDLSLLSAFTFIYLEIGSGNLNDIFNALEAYTSDSLPFNIEIAGVLLVLSACLKSVQVPFHGWLLDVMETPTPVSALLHAGLLNAGPFLIIRFAYLIDLTSIAALTLVIVGAISALFGALVSTTQPSIKTALAYSSVGHMGFTLMVAGLGAYSASLLHLVAHSFYKAHAFLSSGSVIEKVQTKNAIQYKRLGATWRILLGIVASVFLYAFTAYLWGVNQNTAFQLLLIGGIIFFGVLSLQVNSIDSNNIKRSMIYILISSLFVINCFFGFEWAISELIGSQVPPIKVPTRSMLVVSTIILSAFGMTVVISASFLNFKNNSIAKRFRIHLRNGFYFNHLFNRAMNSLSIKTAK